MSFLITILNGYAILVSVGDFVTMEMLWFQADDVLMYCKTCIFRELQIFARN